MACASSSEQNHPLLASHASRWSRSRPASAAGPDSPLPRTPAPPGCKRPGYVPPTLGGRYLPDRCLRFLSRTRQPRRVVVASDVGLAAGLSPSPAGSCSLDVAVSVVVTGSAASTTAVTSSAASVTAAGSDCPSDSASAALATSGSSVTASATGFRLGTQRFPALLPGPRCHARPPRPLRPQPRLGFSRGPQALRPRPRQSQASRRQPR